MTKTIYLETLKSVLGRSLSHYCNSFNLDVWLNFEYVSYACTDLQYILALLLFF